MSAAMTSPGLVSFGSVPYDDVYLEDGSSEEEDEHVISDTRKPLMSPRKRPKVALRQPQSAVGVYPLIKKRLLKGFYILVTALFISLLVFVLIRITHDAILQTDDDSNPVTPYPTVKSELTSKEETLIPCSDFDVQDVWVQNFPKLLTETAIRLVDVNKDGILDIIMGFSTGVTSYFADQYLVCDIYFNGTRPCFGGMMALDGATGTELWRQYTNNEIFAVNCNVDVDKDGVKDCLGGGRSGAFELVSGATGGVIWTFQSTELLVSISNFYTAQFIRDVDGDGVQDILNIHGGDPLREPGQEATHFGLLIILSGATGHVITSMEVPDKKESYYSPQIYYQHGGREMVLFGTGGETHGGSLWVIAMTDLMLGDNSKATSIYTDDYKGIMTPPVLADITGDGVVDIVMSMFNSTTVAIDGNNYKQLWNYTMAESETYSSPGAAYYNDDDIPDFMITYSHGPGYPVYYYAQVTILDGRTGKPILAPPLQTAGSSQVSPLTISMEGYGNDLYIYFILDCLGHEGESNEFTFLKDDHNKGNGRKSRSDFCKQRFNTKSFSRLSALSQHMKLPGQAIYNSLDRATDEYQYTVNSSRLAKAYLANHPQVLDKVKEFIINNGNHHDETGSNHPQERGDQDAGGRVNGVDSEEVRKRPFKDWDGDDNRYSLSNPQEKLNINKLAPRLGFDDEDQIPFINPPVDSEPVDNQYQPQDLYPQKKYPQDVDQRNPDPQDSYPQNPYQPPAQRLGNDPLDMIPSPGDGDETDSGAASTDVLDDLLNQLLQDGKLRDLVDQLGQTRGYPNSKSDLPQSSPKDDWRYPKQPGGPRKKSYFDERYNTQGDTDRRNWFDNRYGDKQGSRHGGGPYSGYDDTDGDKPKRWLERVYGLSPDQSKNIFRRKRDTEAIFETKKNKEILDLLGKMLKDSVILDQIRQDSSNKYESMPNEYMNNELFLKVLEKDIQTKRLGQYRREMETIFENRELPKKQELSREITDDPQISDKSRQDSSSKSKSRPIEYIDNDLFLKLESREPGILELLKERLAGERANEGEAFRRHDGPTNHRQRYKRHNGPHDAGGIQRLISTGTLAPVLIGQEELTDHSIDLIFATYWFYPADTQIILPEQQKCIDGWIDKEAQRLNPKNVFYGLDHDAYEHMAMDRCTQGSTKKQRQELLASMGPLDIYPFNLHTGEMTVYRLRLACRCGKLTANERCAKVLPYKKQQWGGYMGTYGNGHFPPRR